MRLMTILILLLGVPGSPVQAQRQDATPPSAAKQALMQSAYSGQLEEVRSLVSLGTAVDAADEQKRTALMWASFNGHTPVVGFLLEHGAKIDSKDNSGRTALMYASSGPFRETVELLLKHGADVNIQGSLEGFTALMTAAAEGQLEIVRLLLAHGANPVLVDKDGDTAESFARQKGHPEVEALLKAPPAAAPANVDTPD